MDAALKGEVVYLYAFDVADEIRTEGIGEILSKKPTPFEIRQDPNLPKDLPYYRPLSFDPKRDSWKRNGIPLKTLVRVYDVGVVSIGISVPFEDASLQDLNPYQHPVLDNQEPLDQAALKLCGEVVENLRNYLVRGMTKVDIPEAYTIFTLTQIAGVEDVGTWAEAHRREIAGLLLEAEAPLLSEQQVAETFRHCISYYKRDATIIDWNAALVVSLSGRTSEEIYVLELANLQLEELVLMDKRLDTFMNSTYDELERRRHLFTFRRKEIEKLRRFSIDVAKITDEVSNISKFFGDWYLARLYLAARERFHINSWRESIENRLADVDKLYEAL